MASKLPDFRLSQKAGRTLPPAINFLMRVALERKGEGLISLAAGFVDDQTLPAAEVRRLSDELLADETAARAALQYGTTPGLPELREAVLAHICELDGVTPADMAVTPENVVVCGGSQQLLYILSDALLDVGDVAVTGWPSYFVYSSVLRSLGASVRAVDVDVDGMDPEALDATLAELKGQGLLGRVKVVYVCDYYQNPTGLTLSAQRRARVLEVVRSYSTKHRICLLEDAAYRELTYDGEASRSIKSLEGDNAQVVLAQTFSKPFSPGLRTGYAILPDELVQPVCDQKGNHDFGSASFCQQLLLRALRSGTYGRHVQMLRGRYRVKRDAMLAALERELGDFHPAETRWTRPGGGLYVYLTLPPWMDTGGEGPVFSAAMDEGVLYVPGECCYGPDPRRQVERNHMRLTFGTATPEEIDEGVARLSRAVRGAAAEGGRSERTP